MYELGLVGFPCFAKYTRCLQRFDGLLLILDPHSTDCETDIADFLKYRRLSSPQPLLVIVNGVAPGPESTIGLEAELNIDKGTTSKLKYEVPKTIDGRNNAETEAQVEMAVVSRGERAVRSLSQSLSQDSIIYVSEMSEQVLLKVLAFLAVAMKIDQERKSKFNASSGKRARFIDGSEKPFKSPVRKKSGRCQLL